MGLQPLADEIGQLRVVERGLGDLDQQGGGPVGGDALAQDRDRLADHGAVDFAQQAVFLDSTGRGYSLPEFLGGLADHVRDLYVARATGHADLIEGTEEEPGCVDLDRVVPFKARGCASAPAPLSCDNAELSTRGVVVVARIRAPENRGQGIEPVPHECRPE